MVIRIQMKGEGHLSEIGTALNLSGLAPRSRDGWKKHSRQDGDYGNHGQKLDQGKSGSAPSLVLGDASPGLNAARIPIS
jgi:hypothetical protein